MKRSGPPRPLPLDRRARAARALTVFRALAIAPFVALLFAADGGSGAARIGLAALFVSVVVSDGVDGRLARTAGSATRLWGVADVVADAAFNAAALGAAAALGLVGPQAAAAVALLAGVYLVRMLRSGAARPAYDALGHGAGVSFYVLSGLVSAHVVAGFPPAGVVAVAADAVVVYTLFVLAVRVVSSWKSSA